MSEATLTLPPESTSAITESAYRILIIDDEAGIRESLETLLGLEGYAVDTAPDGEAGLNTIGQRSYDLVLLDLALPGMNGIEVLGQIRERYQDLPVIMITAYGTVNNVVDAIRAGAQNFVQKPWDNEKLLADIRASIARYRVEEENIQLKRALKQRYNFENIVGKSESMLRIFDLVAQVAPSRSTILILGESGTGKELIAKALHANSPRRDKNFVPVNTGSMPTDLLEFDSLRPCEGRLHLGHRRQERVLRDRQRRHALPRRDRQHEHGHPGQDPACHPGQALHAPRRSARDPG